MKQQTVFAIKMSSFLGSHRLDRMPGATALETRVTQEKRKVMSAAKNPIESSLGKTLLKTNFSDERYDLVDLVCQRIL